MITAQQAREFIEENASIETEKQKQKMKKYLERILNQAVDEQIRKNSSQVTRVLERGSSLQVELIKEILQEKGFKNISVEKKVEDHDRYVDYWIEISFSF